MTLRARFASLAGWAVAAIIGATVAWATAARTLGDPLDNPGAVPGAVVLLAIATWALHSVLGTYLRRNWTRLPRRTIVTWGVLCVALGGVLFAWTALGGERVARLVIRATGERNPAALASEVWVQDVCIDGSRVARPTSDQTTGDWRSYGDYYVSAWAQPAKAVWEDDGCEKCFCAEFGDGVTWRPESRSSVTFMSHPHAGVAELEWNNVVQRVDLYATEQSSKTVSLVAPTLGPRSKQNVAHCGRDAAAAAVILFALGTACVAAFRLLRDAGRRRQRAALVISLAAGAAAAALAWRVGVGDYACEAGELTVTLQASGGDVLPVSLDRRGVEYADIVLSDRTHVGSIRIAPDSQAKRVAFIGIRDDRGQVLTFEELEWDAPPATVDIDAGLWRRAALLGEGGADVVRFAHRYAAAKALFVFLDEERSVVLETIIDSQVNEQRIRRPKAGVAQLTLNSQQPMTEAATFTIKLPAITIKRIALDTSLVSVGDVQTATVRIPGVVRIDPGTGRNENGVLSLASAVHYNLATRVGGLRAVLGVGACVAALTALGLWVLGSGRREDFFHGRMAAVEWITMAVVVAVGVWLQHAPPTLITNDGIETIKRAQEFLDTGDVRKLTKPHPPGYAAFLSGIMAAGGAGRTFSTVNTVLHGAGVLLMWAVGRRLGGPLGALACAGFFAVNPVLIIASKLVLADAMFTLLVVLWMVAAVGWIRAQGDGRILLSVALAVLWAALMTLRPNAITLLPMIVVLAWLAKGVVWKRAAPAALTLVLALWLHGAVKEATTPRGGEPSRYAWGRVWPLLQMGLLDTNSAEFRPLRPYYLDAMSQVRLATQDVLFARVRADERQPELYKAYVRSADASLRRAPRQAAEAFGKCLHAAYLKTVKGGLWSYYEWGMKDAATYDSCYGNQALSARAWFGDVVGDRVASFKSGYRDDTLAWKTFSWLHRHARHRLFYVTILALLGIVYALATRQGGLLLPAAGSLAIALPLAMLFTNSDRYFLSAEVLWSLQAAVGVRAVVELTARCLGLKLPSEPALAA